MLLIDDEERVLLFLMHSSDGQVFWLTPGGGLEPGETHEQAALRELAEETGWADPVLGPEIGTRRHLVAWGGVSYDVRERWFLARVDRLKVDRGGWTDDEKVDMVDVRWFSVADLAAATERLVPADLAELVPRLLAEGPPAHPLPLQT